MSCCDSIPIPRTSAPEWLWVRYVGARPIAVRGRATGLWYRFSAREPRQLVALRDSLALMGNRSFQLEGVGPPPSSPPVAG